MTEPQKTDHWASLASNLGAEPAPEEPKEAAAETPEAGRQGQTAQAAPPPPAFRPAAKAVHAPRRPAHAPAWEQLAGDLGIAPPCPRRPPHRQPQSQYRHPRSRSDRLRPSYPPQPVPTAGPPQDTVEAELPLPVWDELEPSATEPESFEPQEALDIMDETADEFDDEESDEAAVATESADGQSVNEQSVHEESATEERRSRRRHRRRGRGRGREAAPADEARTTTGTGQEPADDEIVAAEGMESDADSSVQEPVKEDRPEGERRERRGRRRRGRGRPRSGPGRTGRGGRRRPGG